MKLSHLIPFFALILSAFGCSPDQVRNANIYPVAYSAQSPQPAPAQSLIVTIAGKRYTATFSGEISLSPIVDTAVVIPPTDTVTIPPTKSVDGIGCNAFPWVPLNKLQMFSTLRCYIASGWIWRPGGLFCQPLYQAETAAAHGLDDYFSAAKAMGIDVLPCVNLTPDWYAGVPDGSGSNPHPPIKPGLSRTDPKSYRDYAEFWYQFCARYGSTVHPDSELRIDTTSKYANQPKNVKKSGLGLIRFVEIGNEWDRWWERGTEKYLTPQEHVALLIAVMDAIHRADPNMRIVMGGLTGFDLDYLRGMDAAFKAAGKPWPDVINVHHYSSEFNELGQWPPTWKNSSATYPENDKDFPGINAVLAFAKTLGRPVYVTEFGADTRRDSWMHIDGKKFGGITDEAAQAQLIVKTLRKYRELGVARSYVFTAVDEPGSANGGLWQNCGIMTNEATGFQPKPAYHAIRALLDELRANPARQN